MQQIFFIIMALILTACEAPRDRRVAFPVKDYSSSDAFLNSDSTDSGRSASTDDESSESVVKTDENSLPAEIAHCNFSTDGSTNYQFESSHLGPYNLCKSKTSSEEIYVQFKNPSTDSLICFIPTYDNSVYLGEPRCLSAASSTSVYKITLIKNRIGYSSYAITSLMIMKNKAYFYPSPFYGYFLSPDAYLLCMDRLAKDGYTGYCYAFKTVGQYKYHSPL